MEQSDLVLENSLRESYFSQRSQQSWQFEKHLAGYGVYQDLPTFPTLSRDDVFTVYPVNQNLTDQESKGDASVECEHPEPKRPK